MTTVNVPVGANVDSANRGIKGLIDSLRALRRETQSFRGGIKVAPPEEMAALTKTLQQATAAAGAFAKVDFSNLTDSARKAGQQIQKNLEGYLKAQRILNPGAAHSLSQSLAGGANPLAPNFNQMFPTLQGPALQRQMEYYFQSVLRGTRIAAPTIQAPAAGGAGMAAGDSAAPSGRPGVGGTVRAVAGQVASALPALSGLGSFGGFGAIATVGGLIGLAGRGLQINAQTAELKDAFFRQTDDTGQALESLTAAFDKASSAYGQSTNEMLATAAGYRRAALESDPNAIARGYGSAAGFARAYGLDVGQTAGTMGTLARYGVGGSGKTEQREFALMLGTVIRDSGMKAAPDQVLDDLAAYVSGHAAKTGLAATGAETGAYLSFRAATYQDKVLRGPEGMAMLGSLTGAMANGGGDLAQEVFLARAFTAAGVGDLYKQRYARDLGPFADLGELGGTGTAFGALMRQQIADSGGMNRYQQMAMAGARFGMTMPMAAKLTDIYNRMEAQTPGAFDAAAQDLQRRNIALETLNPTAIQTVLDAETATTPALKGMMARYAKENTLSEADAGALNKAAGSDDRETMLSAFLSVVARNGGQDTEAKAIREASKGLETELGKLGKEIQPLTTAITKLAGEAIDKLVGSIDRVSQFLEHPFSRITGGPDGKGGARPSFWEDMKESNRTGMPGYDDQQFLQEIYPKGYVNPDGTVSASAPPEVREHMGYIRPERVKKWIEKNGKSAPAAPSASKSAPDLPAPLQPLRDDGFTGGKYPYQDVIKRVAADKGVPEWALAGVIAQESGFGEHPVGDSGKSFGFGHLNTNGGAASAYGLTGEQILAMSPEEDIGYVADYLKQSIDAKGGNVVAGITRYNGGGDKDYAKHVFERLGEYGFTRTGGASAPASANAKGAKGAKGALTFNHPDQTGISDDLSRRLTATGRKLTILSGYRSPTHNARIGGAKNSMHMHRQAVDIDMKGMSNSERSDLVRSLHAQGIPRFGTYSKHPNMLHVDMSSAQGGFWPMFDEKNKHMGSAPQWFRDVSEDIRAGDASRQSYVPPDVLNQRLADQRGASRGQFGELTLHIDQRVNGETRARTTQRLRAGSGTRVPRMHGDVALTG